MAAGSRRLAEAHRLAQLRLGTQTAQVMRPALALLDITNLNATTVPWLRLVVPLVNRQHARSAQLASTYLRTARALDLGVSAYTPTLATANTQQTTTSLTVTGPGEARRLLRTGLLIPEIRNRVFVSSSRSAMRLTMQGGRDTIMRSFVDDDQAVGWARTGSGKSCGFCSMLISRGPVYSKDTVDFQAHDGCACGAMPVYSRDDGWTDQARELRELWDESTGGSSGQEALRVFRRSVERG